MVTINISDENVMERLAAITQDEMPAVVIDATGSSNAINNDFNDMAHGALYVPVGLQKGEIKVSHPEFQ